MKIVLNAMAHNESLHAQSAMAHFTTLFDEINIIDHCSTDNTAEEISKWNNAKCKINLFRFNEPGYYQSELMTYFARAQVNNFDIDWVFFLDFDEYIPVKSRKELEQILIQHQADPVVQMPWYNLIPVKYGLSKHLLGNYYIGPDASPFCKIAFQPKRVSLFPQIIIQQGNHAITYGPNQTAIHAVPSIGLFHIPIDGLCQLKAKINDGVDAYMKLDIGHKTILGSHWVEMQKVLKTGANSGQLLNSFIANYGDTAEIQSFLQTDKPLLSEADLIAQRYRKINLEVAGAYKTDNSHKPDIKLLKNIQNIALNPNGSLELPSRPKMRKAKNDLSFIPKNGFKIPKLPEHNALLNGLTNDTSLDDFIAESYHKIETLTQTAWGGHIPFMFSLIAQLRPRRYVELGTHYGASFFAACQMFKYLGLPSLAVAIDFWEGDSQAGYYGEEVYNNFEHLRTTRYNDQSRSIRSLFSDAATHFEDSSVDLIHIDGLHTYEAVKEDYNTWRPKLTKNGVMIFHDTNEYLSTYGAWDFFAKIRTEATESFDFKHAHGLGILAFGDNSSNPMISILQQMNNNPISVEQHFSRLGELSVKEALYQLQIKDVSTPREQSEDYNDLDNIGIGTDVMAKALIRRVKNKLKYNIRSRMGI